MPSRAMDPDELPPELARVVAARWPADVRIVSVRPVAGGCINRTSRLKFSNGATAFLKQHPSPPPRFFEAEATGLAALASAGALRIPQVYGLSAPGDSCHFLLLEDLCPPETVPSGGPGPRFDEELGRCLARQHRRQESRFGFPEDNFIGTTPQANGWAETWPEFFRSRRLQPLLQLLAEKREMPPDLLRPFDRLLGRLDDLLATGEPASLLHGDLWSGNILRAGDGHPALVDPAVYFGCREADIAYTDLFGGLSPRALAAYDESFPLAPGWRDRKPLHNVYHLLNHAVIFGGGYLNQARTLAERFV